MKCACDPGLFSDDDDEEEKEEGDETKPNSSPFASAAAPASETPEQEIFESWMERASSFNNVVKRFSKLCDKFTFIENRELFFDINTYLCNTQVLLATFTDTQIKLANNLTLSCPGRPVSLQPVPEVGGPGPVSQAHHRRPHAGRAAGRDRGRPAEALSRQVQL